MAVPSTEHGKPQLSASVWFTGKFCALFFMLEYVYWLIPDGYLRDIIYARGLVVPCVWLIRWLSPGEHLVAQGSILLSPNASLEIIRGCDGAGIIFLLLAAILAFTSSWGNKLRGIALGISLLMLINFVRIIALYFIVVYKPAWFVVSHSYWAPMLMIILGCLFFALWGRYARVNYL